MSTPRTDEDAENDPQGAPRNGVFLRALRVFATLSAVVALYALYSVERVDIDCDLQLAAPPEVRPGEPFAVRALVFCDLDALEGPRLVTPEVMLKAVDEAGRELMPSARPRPLRPTALDTLDGVFQAVGQRDQFLVASAEHEGVPLTVRRALRVRTNASPEALSPHEAGPLQQYSLGRVRALGDQPAPDRLLPRVVGGACVPEVPCTIVLWVGVPAAAVKVRGANVSVDRAPNEPSEGLLTFVLTAHGPEAEVTFEARRGGSPVAERALRLPIALGEVAITGGSAFGGAYTLGFPPGRSAVTLDAFVAGRWRATRATDHASFSLRDLGQLPPGLVRLQARADRFSSEGAGGRMVFAREREDEQAVIELARALASSHEPDGTERWAEDLPDFARADPRAAAAFLLAPAEALRAQVPLPASGRPAQLARLERTKVRMRYGVAGALALSAWLIALSITRRGFLAVDQAQAILDQARVDGADEQGQSPPRERINARAMVLLMGLAVAAAFLAGALLIAAKSLWF
ncbi:MAG TPA: hypothetical protein VFX59_00515 [Polyangiales bacterium]|nr:hypothetical protein [Polyangiales bacterium]